MRRPPEKIVVATANSHKAAEFAAMLALPGLEFVPLSDFPAAGPVEEDGLTLEENALKKARSAAAATGLRALADDTGLEVEALGGAPGVYSARYAGEARSYADNNAKLLRALHGIPPEARRAAFRCVIALCWPDGAAVTAEGRIAGRVLEAPRGADGFGYDPLFLPDGSLASFAELSAEEKNSISHRRAAVRNILPALEKIADEQG